MGWMLKAPPPLVSSYLHLLVLKCNCWTYEENEVCYLGAYNMFDNKFDQYKTSNIIDYDFLS